MTPMMFMVLACSFEFIASIFLIRFLVRRTKYGYVAGSLLMTVVPALLGVRILGAVAAALYSRDLAFNTMLLLLGAFASGSLGGYVWGKISNKYEPD